MFLRGILTMRERNFMEPIKPKGEIGIEKKIANGQEISQKKNEEIPIIEERAATDVILAQISLIEVSASSVRRGYHFTFLKSRATLFIGRDPIKCGEHAIILNDPNIMPCHASIRWKEGKIYLQDEGAGNIAIQNDMIVARTARILPPKATLQFANLVFEYSLEFPNWYGIDDPTIKDISKRENLLQNKTITNELRSQIDTSNTEVPFKTDIGNKNTLGNNINKENGFVIAEFSLISLDSPYALSHHCEIISSRPHFLIGRANHCDYQIEFKDKYVAEEQAVIQYSPQSQTYSIRNLIKENPIFINNKRVIEQERIQPGDIIKLGVAMQAPKIKFDVVQEEKEPSEPLPTPENPVITHEYLFSEVVPDPQRGEVYMIGNNPENTFYIQDDKIPPLLAEITVPYEGDYFLIRKVAESSISVVLDDIPLSTTVHPEIRYGVNQCLKIGNYLVVRNNQRTLPPEITPFPWRKILGTIFWIVLFVSIGIGIYIGKEKYLPEINKFFAEKNLFAEYKKNIFYISVLGNDGKIISSGTGFLLTKKDAYEKDIFYIITCKHIIQPWKFQEHQIKDKQVYNANNELVGNLLDNGCLDSYSIAVWPYNVQANYIEKNQLYLENSFTNQANIKNSLGDIEIIRIGDDNFQTLENGLQKHLFKDSQDIVVLRIKPKENWKYSYYSWNLSDNASIKKGEFPILAGYLWEEKKSFNKEGRTTPEIIKSTSFNQTTEYLEIGIEISTDLSGSPLLDSKNQIIGIVCATNKESRILYGISSLKLIELLK